MKLRQVDKEELKRRAKSFFHSQKWKNFLAFLVFVVLAFCFWMLQYFQQQIEREVTIPIHYTNIPKEIALGDSLPESLTLKLFDKGTFFLRYHLNRNFTPIEINLSHLPLNKTSYTIGNVELLSKIRGVLSSTTQIISFSPDYLFISYSPIAKKELPVLIAGKITPAPGYMFVDDLKIEPPTVWAYGNKTTLDSLSFIETVVVNRQNIRRDLDLTLHLETPKGIQLAEEKVRITGEVEEYTEKKFVLPIVPVNVPRNLHIRFFPSTVEVLCQVALSKYTQLEETDLKVSVDYKNISPNQTMMIISSLSEKPVWLVNYRIVPETVEFLIEHKRD
jgi:hypothetical protein